MKATPATKSKAWTNLLNPSALGHFVEQTHPLTDLRAKREAEARSRPRGQLFGSYAKEERDSQRKKCYTAEVDGVFGWKEPKFGGERLESVRDMERFIKNLWKMKRFRTSFPKSARSLVEINDGRGCYIPRGGTDHVVMPRHGRFTWVLVHELAHSVTRREHGVYVAGHGWQFCSIYLRLVLLTMGREAHDALKASFKKHKVRFTEPRKRKPLSAEQKAVLAARLAAARAAKAA